MIDKSRCTTCGHNNHESKPSCNNCNCGESERIYSGSWSGYEPESSDDFSDRLRQIYQSTGRGDLRGERNYHNC